MSIHVGSWRDGYQLVRAHALLTRGPVVDGAQRWPRTSDGDVRRIAQVFESAAPPNADPVIVERWLTVRCGFALPPADSDAPHADNRSFWSLIGVAADVLDAGQVELPPLATWTALLDSFAARDQRAVRLADAPFGPFATAATHLDVFMGQYAKLKAQRTAVLAEARAGHRLNVPRTYVADVIALVSYWTSKLALAPLLPPDVVAEWRAVLAEVASIARGNVGQTVEYRGNAELWRTLMAVVACINAHDATAGASAPVSVSGPFAPREPATYLELYLLQHARLGQLRGMAATAPAADDAPGPKTIPSATVADAIQLVHYWSAQLAALVPRGATTRDAWRRDPTVLAWQTVVVMLDRLSAGEVHPTTTYAHNYELWRVLEAVAALATVAAVGLARAGASEAA